jgi:hypothetical protein
MVMQPNGFIQAQYDGHEYGQTPFIEAQSVHDGETLAVRLRWPAEKPFNGGREGFPDGAAIAFPVKGEPACGAWVPTMNQFSSFSGAPSRMKSVQSSPGASARRCPARQSAKQ